MSSARSASATIRPRRHQADGRAMSAIWSGTEGGAQASLRPGATPGSWQLGGADGPVIAAIGFRDRSEALALAARSPQAAQVALMHLRALSLRQEGIADPQTLDLAVLDLVGAEVDDLLPSFAETALYVARDTGLGLAEIAAAPATEIDAMARALLPATEEDGATRIVFAAATERDAAGEIEARLRGLLRRAVARPAAIPVAAPATPPPAGPRPFRLTPAGRPPRAAAERPVAGQAGAPQPGSWGAAAPGAPVASATGQPPRRPALSLVSPVVPAAATARPLLDEPFLPVIGSPSPGSGSAAGPSPRAAVLRLALARERMGSGSEERLLAALRMPGWPPASGSAIATPAGEAHRAAPDAPLPWQAASSETLGFAETLAAALEDEADLRGLAP